MSDLNTLKKLNGVPTNDSDSGVSDATTSNQAEETSEALKNIEELNKQLPRIC